MDSSTVYGYTYDGLNRLTKADASVLNVLDIGGTYAPRLKYGDESMSYDAIGNIATLNRGLYYNPSITTPAYAQQDWYYSYGAGNNQLMDIDSINSLSLRKYRYDNNGNSITQIIEKAKNGTDYMRSNLPSHTAITPDTTGVYNVVNAYYDYNNHDDRVYKGVYNDHGSQQYYYLRDASGKELAQYDITNNAWTHYAYGRERIAEYTASSIKYYNYDHLGSTRTVYSVDTDCEDPVYIIENANDYYAFGKTLRSFNGNNKYQFTGKQHDAETNLEDFGARKYDSEIARWIGADKLKDTYPAMSPYNYAANNPIFYKDPDGNVVTPANEESKKLYDSFRANIFKDPSNTQMQKVIERLETSDVTYQIMYTTGKKNEGTINWATPELAGSAGHVVNVNVMVSPSSDEAQMNTYAINILGDEIIGAHQFDTGDLGFIQNNDGTTGTTGYDKWDEISTKIGSIKAAKSNGVDRVGSAQVYEDKVVNAKKWSPEQFIDKYKSKSGDSYKNYITGEGLSKVLMGYMMQEAGISVQDAKSGGAIRNFIYRRGDKNKSDGSILYKTITGN